MVPSVVPSLEVPGGQMGPRGTAGNDKSLRCSISVAVPPGPMLLPLETPPHHCLQKERVPFL